MIKVYGASLSPFVRKVLVTLEYKEVPYEQEVVIPMAPPPGFEKMSPLKKIPVLEHDSFRVPDSSVICRYLDEVFPERSIYPAEARARATACFLEEYGDSKLVETVAPFFFERVVKPVLMKQQPDEARLQTLTRETVPQTLEYLESVVPASGFLVGPTLSIADLGIASPLINARYGQFTPDTARYPKLTAWLERVLATPVFARRLAKEQAEMKAMVA